MIGGESILQAALGTAQRGWHVLPCHTPVHAGCSCRNADCGSPGKHPRTRRGLHDATLDPALITRWWRVWPRANLAIRTGVVSGLVVIDIDPRHGGLDTIRQLADEGVIPPGRRVRTGSGGWHLYFRHPGFQVRNSAGTVLGPGVDVRGDGGYVIAPPSRHVGGPYRWTGPDDVPDLPRHLAARLRGSLRRTPTSLEPVRLDQGLTAWAARALADEAVQVRISPVGARNHRLNLAAFNLGQIVATGLLDAGTVTEHLYNAALAAGLTSTEAERTIRSGLRAGTEHPRTSIPGQRQHLPSPADVSPEL